MKILLAMLMLATPVAAETCREWGDAAEVTMLHRQSGKPISDLMDNAAPVEPQQTRELIVAMILAAYDHPAYRTSEWQLRAVEEFRNDVETLCYKRGGF